MHSSILIFEINKKILLYKILTDELLQSIKTEIISNFGSNYVIEKNSQQKTVETVEENDTSTTERENSFSEEPFNEQVNKPKQEMNLTNDLIYEYFSPIIASFEISKDINYSYEYVLFNKSQHIIRFNLYNNCLILCILSNSLKLTQSESELNKLIFSEYYTSWYCKSFISLIKYKFGICSEEKCFNGLNQIDIKKLYQKWSYLFSNDLVYYIEAVEQLQINEDIKIKCENFLNELTQILMKTETIISEFDYMDESYESLRSNYDEEDESSNTFPFQNDEPMFETNSQKNFKFVELETFFTDLTQINQFILSCGSKLVYKFKLATDSNDNKAFSIDSSSLFMILLEAASFLDYASLNPFNEEDNDTFKSVSSSPSVQSIGSEKQSSSQMTSNSSNENPLSLNSLMDNFQSVYSTPSLIPNSKFSTSDSYRTNASPYLSNKERKESFDDQSLGTFSLEQFKKVTKFKKTNCFLKTSNKSLGFYEILFLKLSDNLCLTLIKSTKLTKYCELISDFDNLIVGFNDLLNRKRLHLSASETDSSLSFDSTSYTNDIKTSKATKDRNLQLDKIDKAFFSFFMNKLIYLFDKLRQLKNELNSKNSDSNSKEKNGLFNKFKRKNSANKSTDRQRNIANKEELMKRNSIKLIHALQFKLNQLTNSKQFKLFVGFINSDYGNTILQTNDELSEILSSIRNIEGQINTVRTNTTDLFYELFLAYSTTITDEIESYDKLAKNLKADNSSASSNSMSTILFKSAYLVDNIKELYKKHIYHYTSYIEVKWRRNTSMSFFCNLYLGLIHFSFINRHDNIGVIPTIDANKQYNIDEVKINLAYRKYLPIVYTFFTKYDCTQFRFNDDKLQVVFSYLIWFEDKKSNYLPIDFNSKSQFFNADLLQNSKVGKSLFDQNTNNVNSNIEKATNQLSNSPGITDKNNYDLLPSICYPNAPINSLTCYELYCIHTPQLDEEKIKLQLSSLMSSLSKRAKNGSFEFY